MQGTTVLKTSVMLITVLYPYYPLSTNIGVVHFENTALYNKREHMAAESNRMID